MFVFNIFYFFQRWFELFQTLQTFFQSTPINSNPCTAAGVLASLAFAHPHCCASTTSQLYLLMGKKTKETVATSEEDTHGYSLRNLQRKTHDVLAHMYKEKTGKEIEKDGPPYSVQVAQVYGTYPTAKVSALQLIDQLVQKSRKKNVNDSAEADTNNQTLKKMVCAALFMTVLVFRHSRRRRQRRKEKHPKRKNKQHLLQLKKRLSLRKNEHRRRLSKKWKIAWSRTTRRKKLEVC